MDLSKQAPPAAAAGAVGGDDWKIGRWRGGVFAVFFVLIALAAVFAHRAYAPFLLLLLIAVDWPRTIGPNGGLRKRPSLPWALYIGSTVLFCIWAAVSVFWSPLPDRGDWVWRFGGSFVLAALAFNSVTYLTPAARIRAAKAVAWGVLAMALLLCFEALTGGLLRKLTPPDERIERDLISLGRGTLLLTLLVWPAKRIFTGDLGRPLLGWALIAIAAIPALSFTIETNAAMLAAGALAVIAANAFERKVISALIFLIIAAIWLTPAFAYFLPLDSVAESADYLPDSWRQRLYIYDRAGGEIATHLFGGGIEYARYLSRPMVTVNINGVDLNTMPIHPHNLFLHIWMDLGIVGAISLTGVALAGLHAIRGLILTRTETAMIAGVLAALLVTATTEWSLWQVWRFAAVWIAMIACRLAISTVPIR
ncbi:MAG: O-antigen ligase family protein [Pseudomonadota bacterium]